MIRNAFDDTSDIFRKQAEALAEVAEHYDEVTDEPTIGSVALAQIAAHLRDAAAHLHASADLCDRYNPRNSPTGL